ncbi:MAG TPA: 1-phosphofructokinase family hexose kinase [Acidobacteriaceae bacterium]|jgi:6-phosphofructokinase 2|nr:1-phosphofructokinase family hexose kinase [Acidobacteriaceae bacterium]
MAGLITTLTLNPALDLASKADTVRPLHKIRTYNDRIDPGGGGINVARVVHALGGETLALVVAGGVTGHYIEDLLDHSGVPRRTIPIEGRTRISLTVFEQTSGLEYRFVPEGPKLSEPEWQAVLAVVDTIEDGWLVLSGSLPPGAPTDAYTQLARMAAGRGVRVALDSSGPALAAAMCGCGIAVVKPSLRELEALSGHPLDDPSDQDDCAMSLARSRAAAMVAVTLGPAGALLATADGVLRMHSLKEPVRTAVGAGDSFVGALVLQLARGRAAREALTWAIAAGATAVAGTGTADVDLERVSRRVRLLQSQFD